MGVEVTCGAAKLAADGCGVEHGELFAQSVAEHAYLFPRRVGDAGWPWVLASMGRSAHSSARASRCSMSSTSMGRYASAMASLNRHGH